MPRRHRFLPADLHAVGVTTRCFQSRLFLLKTRETEVGQLYLGVWAHALESFPDIRLASLITQPNHYHAILLMEDPNPERLASFMAVVNGNIAREMNRALDRSNTFWQAPYSSVPMTASALEIQLKYDLGNGVATGDYSKPKHNPLPNTATAIITEEPMPAKWIRRADYARARWINPNARIEDFTDHLEIKLARLIHRELPVHQYRTAMRHMVREATKEATARRDEAEISLRPIKRLHKMDPLTKAKSTTHSQTPFAFGEPEEVKPWWEAYKEMRKQQARALRAIAHTLGKTVHWPPASHRPPTIRAAAQDLATELAAKSLAPG